MLTNDKKMYELSYPQKSIFLTDQFYGDKHISIISGWCMIKEKINYSKLNDALNKLVKENDAYRITFIEENSEIKQIFKEYSYTEYEKLKIKDIDELREYLKNKAYCIATQTGIWNREFLRKLAQGKESAWEFERYGSFDVGNEQRALLVTQEKEFPFIDAVHKGCWEKFGVKCLEDNGITFDFSKRGLPSFRIRLIEVIKAFIFAIVPTTLLVRVQNALGIGAKEIRRA